MSSRSPRAADDLSRAEETISRRTHSGLTFTSVHKTLGWYFEARERMQSAQSMHPRGEPGTGGEVVFLSVAGGKGGDIDEVLATISTVGAALRALHVDYPRAHAVLVAFHRDGQSLRDQARRHGMHHQSMSVEFGKGEAYLVGLLRRAGVLR